jgi:NHLM bacteriocin system ABC transporter peptidase/ATP-binding protein
MSAGRRTRRRKRVRTRTVFQMEATECGAACLAMILGYYGRHEPLENLREACGVSRNGSVASLLLKAARGYGLEARGYKMPADKLDLLPRPSILFWNFDHFVVYEGRSGDRFYINDPALGPQRLDREAFERAYSGVVLGFEPGEGFTPARSRRGLWDSFRPMLAKTGAAAAAVGWAGLLLVVPGLLLPAMLRIFIDEVLPGKAHWLYSLLAAMGLTMLVQALLIALQQAAFRRGELKLGAENTLRALEHLFSLPLTFFTQRTTADLQQRVALNAGTATRLFEMVAANGMQCFTAAFFLLLMVQLSLTLSCIAVGAALLSAGALALVNRRRQTLNQSLMMAQVKFQNQTMTGVAMMESLRAGGRDDGFFNQWASSLAELVAGRQKMGLSTALFNALPAVLAGLNQVLVLCFGAWRIIEGDMTLGSMMAFLTLMGAFLGPVNALVGMGAAMQELKGAVDRIDDIYHYAPERRFREEGEAASPPGADGAGRLEAPDRSPRPPLASSSPRGKLELRDVSFGYSRFEPPVLSEISFVLEPGRSVALAGASGSGKSTIGKLAAGLHAPWSGQVLLDDRPLEDYSRDAFNHCVAAIGQDPMLFSGTIRDNLTLYRQGFDEAALHEALADAAISDELLRRGGASELALPVGEGGNNFSGGQRQRLEIARALARRTPVLILDEATSALDPVTEKRIYAAVRRRGAACLVVAHRLSSIRSCDEILLLENGRVVERGSHEQLMALDDRYARLMRAM